MSMTINTNMDATRTLNQISANHALAHKHLMKVSTGMKVRNAQDDASAYAISEHMRVRIRALEQAHSNTQNGSNMMRTAEGAVSKIVDALRTLKEKAINAANDSNSDEDRRMIQREFDQLVDQIDEDALITFNNKYLIDGTRNNAFYETNTVLFNNNLSADSFTDTALTELKSRSGDSLGIQSDDKYTVSWVFDGRTMILGGTVGDKKIGDLMTFGNDDDASQANGSVAEEGGMYVGNHIPLADVGRLNPKPGYYVFTGDIVDTDKFGRILYPPNNGANLAILSADGATSDISGYTISITDSEGNVKKSANAALEFKLLKRGETQTGDQALSFHVGADANFATKFALTDMRTKALGLRGNDGTIISVSTKEDANASINVIDNVLTKVLDEQSQIGSALSRLERTATNLTTQYTDDQASESVIRDADVATEMAGYLKYNVLSQASQAMLAQANQNPMDVLALIGNLSE